MVIGINMIIFTWIGITAVVASVAYIGSIIFNAQKYEEHNPHN